jgi:hypothetical protein
MNIEKLKMEFFSLEIYSMRRIPFPPENIGV